MPVRHLAPSHGLRSPVAAMVCGSLLALGVWVAGVPGCAAREGEREFPFSSDDTTVTRPAANRVAPMFIGTGGFGFGFGSAFPGAAAPQGLVKVGPDTSGRWGRVNFLHYSGYWHEDDTIVGFSHMHLHGTGAADYGLIGLMPLPTGAFDAAKPNVTDYASAFQKATESASPGFYGVTLTNGTIGVAITATAHAAHHRYIYGLGAASGTVLLDLAHHLAGTVENVAFSVDAPARIVRGSFLSKGGMSRGFGGVQVHFVLRTRTPWTRATTGAHSVAMDFDLAASPGPVEVQVGVSLVSVENALGNLEAEMPAFAFENTKSATASAWRALTDAITFEGASADEEAMREAAMVHAFLMPTVVSDVNGEYTAFSGGALKHADFPVVSDMSLWDTYRTLHPLYALIAPERASGAVRSLLAMRDDLGFFPKWPIGTGESGVMLGASADVVIADAYVRGVRGFDAERAYESLRALALDPVPPPQGRGPREHTLRVSNLGYVPAEVGRSVSWTIEYGQDDFALANLAQALGHAGDAATFSGRAGGWKNLLDPRDGFLWSKNADGSWATTHGDPASITEEFAEANPWQSVFGPIYDHADLVQAHGGPEKFVAKLREFFVLGKEEYDLTNWRSELSAGSRRSYFWGGNEPDIHAAYLFALAGRPDLTQKWVRWVDAQMFTAGADGLPGNDDGGTMSAWLLFDWLGFFPLAGSEFFILGAPKFPAARVRVPGGAFSVRANGVSPTAIYVQSVSLDGTAVAGPLLAQSRMKAGSTLTFVMGERPSAWGR